MASFNRVILMGNLTRDPELKTLPSGMRVAKLGLAVSETWRDRSTNELREVTCFVDIDVWDRQADLCAQYLNKGRAVLIEGRLRMDEWTNKEGEKRTKLVVRADNVRFIGPAPQRNEDGTTSPAPAAAYRAAAPAPAAPTAASAPTAPAPVPYQAPDATYHDGANAMTDEDLPF